MLLLNLMFLVFKQILCQVALELLTKEIKEIQIILETTEAEAVVKVEDSPNQIKESIAKCATNLVIMHSSATTTLIPY